MFRDLIPQLADRFRLVAPDLPGFGQSDMPAWSAFIYTFENRRALRADVAYRFQNVSDRSDHLVRRDAEGWILAGDDDGALPGHTDWRGPASSRAPRIPPVERHGQELIS